MGTRSTIAVKHEDGTVSQVYCHWDGYIENNGKLLVENYNSRALAELLVSSGNISSLGKYAIPRADGNHTYNTPEKDVTVYYGRDRGEDEQGALKFDDMEDYRKNMQSEEYDYLFVADAWFVLDHGEFAGVVSELLEKMAEEE